MQEAFNAVIAKIMSTPLRRNEGDYYEGDILHCGVCKGAKSTRFIYEEINELVSVTCRCQSEKMERERLRERVEANRDYVKSLGVTDAGYERMTLANSTENLDFARKYVENWDRSDPNYGLLLYGGVGTGKTYAAYAIGNALADRGERVLSANISRLTDKLAGFGGNSEFLEKLVGFDLLIIDDFGATRETAFVNEKVYQIINARYIAEKPMIITTNLSPDIFFKENQDISLCRSYQRVAERCCSVKMNGRNHRKDIAGERRGRMNNLLFGGDGQ